MTSEMHKKIFELTLAVYRVTDPFPRDEALRSKIREKANEIIESVSEYGQEVKKCESIDEILSHIQSMRMFLGIARFSRMTKAINIAVLDREYDFFANFFTREREYVSEGRVKNDESRNYQAVSIPARKIDKKPKVERSLIYSQRVSLENGNGNSNGNSGGNENVFNESNKHQLSEFIGNEGTGCQKSQEILEKGDSNTRQQTILDYLKANEQVRSSDLSGLFQERLSIKTLQRDLSSLIEQNIIERHGEKRWAVYKLRN